MSFQGEQKGNISDQVAVVIIPLPAQGHLNPLLQLSHLIASSEIPVHYVGSAHHIRQVKTRAYELGQPNSTIGIHFHEILFIPMSQHPPKLNSSSNKFPSHLQRIIETSNHLRRPVAQLLRSISPKFRRIIVIHDSLMASVVEDVKFIQNAESYTFHTSSAFTIFFTLWELMVEKPFKLGSDTPGSVPNYVGCSSPEFEKFLANQYSLLSMSSGRLYNTCASLEGKYMDLLRKLPVNQNKKLYAIGPLHGSKTRKSSSKIEHRCLDWLDKQEKDSVIFVSFGTTTSFSDEQVRELAIGLEKSGQNFLWVLRDADNIDIFQQDKSRTRSGPYDQLPEGYVERTRNRGLIVRDWVPQVEVLGHEATGGFISHCGWNSCLESVTMGVPLATWPIHSDQPKISVLVTEVLKVGVVVKEWADRRDDVVRASVVEDAVRKLMVSKEGLLIRKRARELGVKVRGSTSNGGDSCLELDSFVAHITRDIS